MIGVLVFVVVVVGLKIWIFFSGGDVLELVFGLIVVYVVVIVIMCLGLVWNYCCVFVKFGK